MIEKILNVVIYIVILAFVGFGILATVKTVSSMHPREYSQWTSVDLEVPHTSYWEIKTATVTINEHLFLLIANSRMLSAVHSPNCPCTESERAPVAEKPSTNGFRPAN